MYSKFIVLYTVHCTLYTVHCKVNNLALHQASTESVQLSLYTRMSPKSLLPQVVSVYPGSVVVAEPPHADIVTYGAAVKAHKIRVVQLHEDDTGRQVSPT